MKIVLDTLGSDAGEKEIVSGGLMALAAHSNLELCMVGNKSNIELEIASSPLKSRIEIVDAPEIILNTEAPVDAIRTKKNSSVVVGLEQLKSRDDLRGYVSAGSTGGVLTGAFMKLGRIQGISRPALAPLLPTKIKDKNCLLIDCGANVDCKPENLLHFALMGTAYMEARGIVNPRVAIVCNGVEDKKGNELTHEAFKLLRESKQINFVGNMEAREAFSGDYDILVCDGFVGNVLLKTAEGAFKLAQTLLKQALMKRKLGALMVKGKIKEEFAAMDYEKVGGSPFLGAKEIVIKAHGASNARSIRYAIELAKALAEQEVIKKIEAKLEM